MSEWLRGRPERVALVFGGDAVRYGELARAVDAAVLPAGPGPVGCRAGAGPAELVVTVLACLVRGRAVVVGADQAAADRLGAAMPDGTELALTTSGSTATDGAAPRVIARTSASWLASAAPLADVARLGARDRVAVTGPLHVSMHLYAVLHALWLGATATDLVDGASVVHATPTRLARLAESPAMPPAAIVAGAALGERTRARAEARGVRLTEYYGAAELSFVLAGSGGSLAPFPGVDVELRAGGAGDELWARSPYLALGVVGGTMRRDERGFATVGDLAERTADGGLRVLGRGDAAITTAGATVPAEQVEARLAALPGVRAAAVVGEPHELLGQRIAAVLELDDGVGLEQVAAAARASLSPVELPRRWFAHALPRTESGKLARGVLRDAIVAGRLGPGHPAPFERGSRA
ncbi:class I adenylate-forming enzyme family protein [Agromyces aurantiacus]|uniref:Class I adenylate-forming enzyme family protein n=1 Tax=Agromyces aurantiacus TaxID=165814 RepID=A0ABV9R8C7_9MICO|nr:long-chain fatty acid--CoA ligase [Agromyces aurantiacus]MBM7505144.1 acyl-coenzyme A synthetase/AMP-(fatty) acid ligase [Agromyces aurantiacus]